MIAVAIDGPAGAGKSSISKEAAKQLGFVYVDTGALYRSAGLFAMRKGFAVSEADQIIPCLPEMTVRFCHMQDGQHVFLNDEDITEEIRSQKVSAYASAVAALPEVRAFLFDMQQQFAAENNVIMDGRDIGTVVLPHAQVKIYLTASVEERAKRRYLELIKNSQQAELSVIEQEIRDRDEQDMNRKVAPLKKAEDAVLVDTSELNFEESVAAITALIQEKLN